MPQPVKLSDPLIQAARDAAQDAERSIAGQIEHWARLGRAIESRLSVEEAVRLKRGEWGALAVHEPAQNLPSDDVAPLAPRRRRDARPGAETGIPPWLERQRVAIEALCGKFGVRRLAFFGSVLRPDFNPAEGGSDIDATVAFRAVAGLPSARQFFDFKTALDQQLQRAVDLVELESMPDTRLKRIIASTERLFHVDEAP